MALSNLSRGSGEISMTAKKLFRNSYEKKALNHYETIYRQNRVRIEELLKYCQERKWNIAIWGCGLKGIAFLNVVDGKNQYIQKAYDKNKDKYGDRLPTGHVIVDYMDSYHQNVDLVLLMNTNYEAETSALLTEAGMNVIMVNIDGMLVGNLSIEEALGIKSVWNESKDESKKLRIAASVVIYNEGIEILQNIETYKDQVERVFVYDNSTNKNQALINHFKEDEKYVYLDGMGNQGLSVSHNVIGNHAIAMGFDWVITFDQDSQAHPEMIARMKQFIESYANIESVGIVCPSIKNTEVELQANMASNITYDKWVFQSGSMLNLTSFRAINGYDEKLFIDEVDFDYCLRLLQKGYRIIRVNNAILIHNTNDGNVVTRHTKNGRLYINKYSPLRYYYITRNGLYCTQKYKHFDYSYYLAQSRHKNNLLRTLWYEKNKGKKLKSIALGYYDYIRGNMGKANYRF